MNFYGISAKPGLFWIVRAKKNTPSRIEKTLNRTVHYMCRVSSCFNIA